MMRTLQILLAVGFIVALAWLILPHPLEGCWIPDYVTPLNTEHQFIRFAEGQSYLYHPYSAPVYEGTYRKFGWNRYMWPSDSERLKGLPATIVVGWFRSSVLIPGSPSHVFYLYRDWRLWDTTRVMRLSEVNALSKRSIELPSAGAADSRSP